MSESTASYELSLAAEQDLRDIFDYTVEEFDLIQAEKYTLAFEDLFVTLTTNPESGKTRNEIKAGLRSIPKGVHIVFYRILSDRIRIVRILHQRKDIRQFTE